MGVAPSVVTKPKVGAEKEDNRPLLPGDIRLPREIEYYILSFLTYKDVCCASLTSRRWCEALNDEALWKDLFVRRFGEKVSQTLLEDKGWKGAYLQYVSGGGRATPEGKAPRGFFDRLNLMIRKDPGYAALLLGLDGAGKTSMMYRLNEQTAPTIGFSVESYCYNGFRFTLWDLGGQDKIRPLWKHYMPGLSAVIFAIDSADQERFEEVRKEILSILNLMEEVDPLLPSQVAFLILANKQDNPKATRPEELVTLLDLHELFEDLCWKIYGCSTIADGDGVTYTSLYEPFEWLRSVM